MFFLSTRQKRSGEIFEKSHVSRKSCLCFLAGAGKTGHLHHDLICFQQLESFNLLFQGHPRCNIIYLFSLFYGLLSGLGSFLRMFCFLCFTPASAVSNQYTTIPRRGGDEQWCKNRHATRRGIYQALFTDHQGDSCFSIYQISWIKMKKVTFL